MAAPHYVYTMQKLSKTYPGGKPVLKDIHLSFLPGAKIGVVGVKNIRNRSESRIFVRAFS